MEENEIIKKIEELDTIELNDALLAMCSAYERINPENELVMVALPKNNPEKRKQIIEWFCKMEERSQTV